MNTVYTCKHASESERSQIATYTIEEIKSLVDELDDLLTGKFTDLSLEENIHRIDVLKEVELMLSCIVDWYVIY